MSSNAPEELTLFAKVCDITGYIRNEEGGADAARWVCADIVSGLSA